MKAEARELDQLVRDWWLCGKEDKLFERILERALTGNPESLLPFARALQILETKQLRPSILQRIDELRQRLDCLRNREWQIDALGNLDNEPQSLFAVLSNELVDLRGFAPETLRRARLAHQESRGRAARAFLEALGWDKLPGHVASALQQAVDDISEREQQEAWGLFVGGNLGLALGVKLVLRDSGQELFSDADNEMREQARIAARLALNNEGWDAKLEWPARFAGESIGLPLYIAALVARNVLPRHALTASTGRLDIDGRVTGVSGINAKVEAARRIGIRRTLVPRENLREAKSAAGEDVIVLAVEHVREVIGALRQPISAIELGYSALILLIRASVQDYQLAVQDECEASQGFRFVVANASGKAYIWVYRNGRVRAEGSSGPALDAANRLVLEQVPPDPEERETLSFQLPTPQLREGYRSALNDIGAVDDDAHEHEAWRVRLSRGRSRVTVVLYNSGKCVIQGTAPAWDLAREAAASATQSIGGLPTKPSRSTTTPGSASSPEGNTEPHIGTDEAGKGDYFGPLVSAAVFVDRIGAAMLKQLGVKDSKTLSDRRIKELADKIRGIPEIRHAVTAINPKKFNELYEQFRREGKNLNSLLAWGHSRSIDTLLNAPEGKRVNAKYVLVDQFADKHYIEQRTRRAGIPVHQRPKAEEDIAVAAASVLARDGFLRWLERWSERTQTVLPKGASPQVVQAAKQFVRRWGAKWLGEVAKLNFRTTAQVLDGEDKDVDKGPPEWIADATDIPSES
jgi:ribonuclease HIII